MSLKQSVKTQWNLFRIGFMKYLLLLRHAAKEVLKKYFLGVLIKKVKAKEVENAQNARNVKKPRQRRNTQKLVK